MHRSALLLLVTFVPVAVHAQDIAFTPMLSLETYVQPLISTGDYGAPKQLIAARSFDFVPFTGTLPSRDFDLERDGRNLFAIRPDNIFVVKMSY